MNIEYLKLTPKITQILKKHNLNTTESLAVFFPRTYHDYRKTVSLQNASVGEFCAVQCVLDYCGSYRGKRSYLTLNVHSAHKPTERFNIFLFNEVYRYSEYCSYTKKEIVICGKITEDEKYGKNISSIENICLASDFKGMILPVYKKMAGISENTLKKIITDAISVQPDILELPVRQTFNLSSYRDVLYKLHLPKSIEEIEEGRKEKYLYDLIYFCLILFEKKKENTESKFKFKKWDKTAEFIKTLAYSLTQDQKSLMNQIVKNAEKGNRNNILIQGDVGCGKTIVAICMMCCAMENGFQSVLMAPREVLAKQHYDELMHYAERLNANVVFLRSGMKAAERKKAIADIKNGKANFIVGTHSCISKDVVYSKLGLIITDEEHLFGVKQKEALEEKAQKGVHCLSMSATPIPRSLATVLYGEHKEIFTIKTMPNGRKPIQTCAVKGHKAIFNFILKQAKEKHRTYVVCPAIEENEEYNIISVEKTAELYKEQLEPEGIKIGVIHGKMKAAEIEKTVSEFSKGELDVLISTTVIEVGVNVPEATLMIVEQADRFGLATLHQLRGRVGRSNLQSYCVLRTDNPGEPRIRTMCETTDGFKIAEADMNLRGAGNLIGTEQSGMNTYVSEMLYYPDIFKRAREIERYCQENRYGHYIVHMYELVN